MNKYFAIKLIALQAIITPATSVFSHELNGLSTSHWHTSDTLGFIILAAAIAMVFWYGRGRK